MLFRGSFGTRKTIESFKGEIVLVVIFGPLLDFDLWIFIKLVRFSVNFEIYI